MNLSLRRPLPEGVGRVSQWFGSNPDAYKRFGLAGHNGLDYSVPAETRVLAAHDVLAIYPDAALCKAGAARGLWPTSNEFRLTVDGAQYVGQRFRDPRSDLVVVLYCRDGDWGNVLALEYVV